MVTFSHFDEFETWDQKWVMQNSMSANCKLTDHFLQFDILTSRAIRDTRHVHVSAMLHKYITLNY